MSSRIEQLIDEIEEYIEGCKPKFMSSTEIIVNKDEIDELLRELRMKTPDDQALPEDHQQQGSHPKRCQSQGRSIDQRGYRAYQRADQRA